MTITYSIFSNCYGDIAVRPTWISFLITVSFNHENPGSKRKYNNCLTTEKEDYPPDANASTPLSRGFTYASFNNY